MKLLPPILVAAALALAGVAGYFATTAFGVGQQAVVTTTVDVGTGARGPTGPQGPAGPSGQQCPTGYEEGVVVVNHAGGRLEIFTCVKR